MAFVEVFARTEVGCVRERNEDAFLVLDLARGTRSLRPGSRRRPLTPPGTVIAVFDGMGGAAAGDRAARTAAATLEQVCRPREPLAGVEGAESLLRRGLEQANRDIAAAARADPGLRGMGTTMTAALILGPDVVVAHVGDSRAYLRRGFSLRQLTRDHTVGAEIAAAQAARKPEGVETAGAVQRSILVQALGVVETLAPDVLEVRVCAGDVLLLCSDGLTDAMTDAAILEIMVRHEDVVRCCRALTEHACRAGGPDNITVAVARFFGEGLALPGMGQPLHLVRRSNR